jgi:hypothetical protein
VSVTATYLCDCCGTVIASERGATLADIPAFRSLQYLPIKGQFCDPCQEVINHDPVMQAAFLRLEQIRNDGKAPKLTLPDPNGMLVISYDD